ncbi:substrate-binding periplasmic protein [Niveispirillum fermenti]|uniref:substrate-binding periplasmic protein n=1 Tax=Niveispirillum fermenti TaxID=1233113 RepID=UPI003A8A7089
MSNRKTARGLLRWLGAGSMVAALGLWSAVPVMAAGGKELLLLTETNPPANFEDALTGELVGLAADKVRLIMQETGIAHEYRILPWLEAEAVLGRTANACIFLINLTEERKPLYQWVGPLMEGGWALFASLGFQQRITKPEDLAGLRIAVQGGGALEKHLRDMTRDVAGVTLVPMEGAAEIGALFNGQADLFAGGAWAAPYQARQAEVPVRMVMRLTRSTGAMACNKRLPPATVARMQKALDNIIGDGRASAIERRYSTPGSWGSWGLDRRDP